MSNLAELAQSKIDGRKLTHGQSEYIRIAAVKAVRENKQSPEQVIQTFGLHRTAIYKWLRLFDTKGYAGLQSTKASGPPPKLTEKQQQRLAADLLKNPVQLKFEFALWTVNMVVELIERRYGILYSSVQVGRLLKKWGLSRQKPLESAWQQDPEQVEQWLQSQYPAIAQEAKKESRAIYFGDEAGFEATAQYGTTWAKKGETPVIEASGQRQKVNCISAISKQGRLRFMLYEEKFTALVFITFLMRLLHKQQQPVTLIVDGHRSHFTAAVQAYIDSTKGRNRQKVG